MKRVKRSLCQRVERALERIKELPSGTVIAIKIAEDKRLVEISYVPKSGQPGDPN